MKLLLVLSTIIVPLIMVWLAQKKQIFMTIFNGLAVVSLIIFGSIAATNIYQVIKDDDVFMTTIHRLFLNELFLLAGAYVGAFAIYRFMRLVLEER